MRHFSERVEGKNYRDLNGRPLFSYVIDVLRGVPAISRIVVDTDSGVIGRLLREMYPEVVVLDRPDHLRDGRVPMTDVIAHDVSSVESDWFVQTHSTNPFLSAGTICRALAAVEASDCDSLFGVSRWQGRLYNSEGQPINHDPAVLLRTQDLAPIFVENSTLYVFDRQLGLAGRRIGDRPLMFEVGGVEALDIDTEEDWLVASALMKAAGG